jgi:hypothetical protein
MGTTTVQSTRFNGMGGSVTCPNFDLNVKQWEVNITVDHAEGLDFSSADDWFIQFPGGKHWRGSFTAHAPANTTFPLPAVGLSATFASGTTGMMGLSGTISIVGIRQAVRKSADLVEISFEFIGSGAPTATGGPSSTA